MIKNLNNEQLKAVEASLGSTMVIAGPGSGKTHVIINRVNYMVNTLKCREQNMLVITFTKAAALEMKERYTESFGESRVHFGTFHAIFFKMLRMSDSKKYNLDNLLSEERKKYFIEKIYRNLNDEEYEDFVEVFLGHMTLMKNQLIQPAYYHPDGLSRELFLKVYTTYEELKEQNKWFDFDDMLIDCYHLLSNNEEALKYFRSVYKYVLIDEFQDINSVQFEIIRLLVEPHNNIFVVGDDDQSIYRFRGAKPEFLLNFEEYFSNTTKIILDTNYRSTKEVLQLSNTLISHNKKRFKKVMDSFNGSGEKVIERIADDSKAQATYVLNQILQLKEQCNYQFSDFAIIYRTNIQARPLLEVLLATNVPFTLRDTVATLYDQWITKDILAYFKLANDLKHDEACLQIINRPSRYISKVNLQEAKQKPGSVLSSLLELPGFQEWQKDRVQELIFQLQALKKKKLSEGIHYIRQAVGYDKYILEYANYRRIPSEPLLELLDELEESCKPYETFIEWEEAMINIAKRIKEESRRNTNKEGVLLTTMHSAKGLEFKTVFVIDVVEGVIPHNKSVSENEIEEERRLFYVALTRAKERLFILSPKVRYDKQTEKSVFKQEMYQKPFELNTGDTIIHQVYGEGKVLKLNKTIADIAFEKKGNKKIDYKVCLSRNIIKIKGE